MKHANKIFLLLILAALLVFPTSVFANSPQVIPRADKVVFGGSFTLNSGETIDGNLAVFGGSATVENNARVTGDVVLAGGSLTINGEVDKNVAALGGSLFLGDTALVRGDVSMLGATLHRATNARILGSVHNATEGPFQFNVPGTNINQGVQVNFRPLVDALWFFFRTLVLAALAMLVALFLPNPINRVAHAVVAEPVTTGGLGILTAIIAPILVVILAITIILIPVALLGIFILAVAGLFGWIVIGTETGKRIAGLFKADWPLAVSAGIGTFVMSLIAGGIGFIPCIGWLASALIFILGVGAVILTRFGTMVYPTSAVYAPVAPYYPPAAPVPPAPRPPEPPVPPAPPLSGPGEPPSQQP